MTGQGVDDAAGADAAALALGSQIGQFVVQAGQVGRFGLDLGRQDVPWKNGGGLSRRQAAATNGMGLLQPGAECPVLNAACRVPPECCNREVPLHPVADGPADNPPTCTALTCSALTCPAPTFPAPTCPAPTFPAPNCPAQKQVDDNGQVQPALDGPNGGDIAPPISGLPSSHRRFCRSSICLAGEEGCRGF
jgi:hypothetical protein